MTERRLAGLNPPQRPATPPRTDRVQAASPPDTKRAERAAARPKPATKVTKATKAGKVMLSVPGDALSALRDTAQSTGKTNTDIVLECLVAHGEAIQAHADQTNASELTALQRRVRASARRDRPRAGQLSLYLTPDERAEVDDMAGAAGMNRSQLITEALDRGLKEVQ